MTVSQKLVLPSLGLAVCLTLAGIALAYPNDPQGVLPVGERVSYLFRFDGAGMLTVYSDRPGLEVVVRDSAGTPIQFGATKGPGPAELHLRWAGKGDYTMELRNPTGTAIPFRTVVFGRRL